MAGLTKLITGLAVGIIVGAGGAIVLASKTQDAPTTTPMAAPPSYEMPHMKRPNLVVSDLNRSLEIYRDVLGFTAAEISVSGDNSFSYPVFNIPKGSPMRSVTLHEAAEQRVLALTELRTLDLPRPASAPFMSTIVIGITDLEGKFAKLESMGLRVTETRVAGGADFTFIEQAFVDPDGHLVVCYEVLPDNSP